MLVELCEEVVVAYALVSAETAVVVGPGETRPGLPVCLASPKSIARG